MINLQASAAPIGLPAKNPSGNEHSRLYQIQRVDDGRIRYRLRLGSFATEDEAEAMLAKVRLDYPGALMVVAAADDLHAIALVRGPQAVVDTPPGTSPAAAPARTAASAIAPAPARPSAPATASAPAQAVSPPAPTPARPAPPQGPRQSVVSADSDIASKRALMKAIDADFTAAPASARRDVPHAGAAAPSLESTQTLRPLTLLELDEHETPRWFVIQLAVSQEAFDPEALPHLDIFSLYRLYTVVGLDQGRLVHALRLGFFGEEMGACAVANYLAAFYSQPTIKRVSVAERDRFAEQRVEARKDVGATGRHLAIEITDELMVRERRISR